MIYIYTYICATTPCSCQLHYIGQTGRTAATRNKEEAVNFTSAQNDPQKAFQSTNYNDYGYVHHFRNTGHILNFNECIILAKEKHNIRRKFIEGMFIQRNKNNLVNINTGVQPDSSWRPIIDQLPERNLQHHLDHHTYPAI